jgi:hypothetical protein
MEVSDQSYAPAALTPVKEPPVSIIQEAGWFPGSVWTLCRREEIFGSAWNRTLAVQPVAIPTELSHIPVGSKYFLERFGFLNAYFPIYTFLAEQTPCWKNSGRWIYKIIQYRHIQVANVVATVASWRIEILVLQCSLPFTPEPFIFSSAV